MEKFILGLDASTSKVGFSIFSSSGELLFISSIPLESDCKTKIERLKDKADMVLQYFETQFKTNLLEYANLERVVIEESLPNSKQAETFVSLKWYNEYLRVYLPKVLKVKSIDAVTVYDSRCYGIPNLMGVPPTPTTAKKKGVAPQSKTPTLFGAFSKTVKDNKKYAILAYISHLYPKIKWDLNKNLNLSDSNLDMSDSVCAVLGYMKKHHLWENTPIQLTNEDVEKFVGDVLEYQKQLTLIDSQLKGQKEAKFASKKALLESCSLIERLHLDLSNVNI